MRRVGKGFSGVETPLFENMLVVRAVDAEEEVQVLAQDDVVQEHVIEEIADDDVHPTPTSPLPSSPVIPSSPPHQSPSPPQPQAAEGSSQLFQQVLATCSALVLRVKGLETANAAQQLKIIKLQARVKKLERLKKVKSSKLRRLKKVGTSQLVESSKDVENVFNQGRKSVDMETDEGIELEVDQEKCAEVEGRQADTQAEIYNIDLDHSSKVLNMQEDTEVQEAVEVVTTAKLITEVVTAAATQPKYIKRYHGLKKKPQSESKARKNKISYLRNTEGYKMEFFKGLKYDDILPIFQAKFDANMRFLFKTREEMEVEDEEIIKSINETPAQKAAKRRRLHEQAKEDADLKKQLEVVVDEDDDVFIKATPIGRKVPVVNYEIVMINNKPRYKIIRADDTYQSYTSFITLLKNFDREDLEDLWRIVKAIFSTSKPTNFSDDYPLSTLKTMFKKTDGQDAIWRSQQTAYGQALVKSWKLLTSCGVHIISLTTTMFVLLVERRYPLSKFTLEQLVNVARLQVEEESEMSLELLREENLLKQILWSHEKDTAMNSEGNKEVFGNTDNEDKEVEPKKMPVWVKNINVSLEAWCVKRISALESSLGKPMVMDFMTTIKEKVVEELRNAANKFSILNSLPDDNEQEIRTLKERVVVDKFLIEKLQPTLRESITWSKDMIDYFKERWEEDRLKERNAENEDIKIEDVLEINNGTSKVIGDNEVNGIEGRVLNEDFYG
nr:hypothetical protein [Tanacetum cinerariifolium]